MGKKRRYVKGLGSVEGSGSRLSLPPPSLSPLARASGTGAVPLSRRPDGIPPPGHPDHPDGRSSFFKLYAFSVGDRESGNGALCDVCGSGATDLVRVAGRLVCDGFSCPTEALERDLREDGYQIVPLLRPQHSCAPLGDGTSSAPSIPRRCSLCGGWGHAAHVCRPFPSFPCQFCGDACSEELCTVGFTGRPSCCRDCVYGPIPPPDDPRKKKRARDSWVSKSVQMLDWLETSGPKRFTEIQRYLWSLSNGPWAKRCPRGYWCTILLGGPRCHGGLLRTFAEKQADGRWKRKSNKPHHGHPWSWGGVVNWRKARRT
jgi:hypothetical protein